jgi:putative flippase GtrA
MDNISSTMPVQENAVTRLLERFPIIYQFLRFAAIGFLNAALNFLILNGMSKALGISQGWSLGAVEAVAFALAVVQSYLWNRTWTFGTEQGVSLWKNVVRLILVGALGVLAVILVLVGSAFSTLWLFFAVLLVVFLVCQLALWRGFGFHTSTWDHKDNSFLPFLIVTLVGWGINVGLVAVISAHLHLTHSDLDKNIALVIATAVSLFWNFFGYKAIVFKK